jgi:hypothetical protein
MDHRLGRAKTLSQIQQPPAVDVRGDVAPQTLAGFLAS